jgi:hypothetical protein
MNRQSLVIGFCLGFLVASVIGMTVVVPFCVDNQINKVSSDYCRPLHVILMDIEATAATESCPNTLAKLRALNLNFMPYSPDGPTPHDWAAKVTAATPPAGTPAPHPSTGPGR